jgi:hypothetical protein
MHPSVAIVPPELISHRRCEILVGVAKRMINQLGIATAALESVLLPDR